METAQTLTMNMDIEEAACQAPKSLSQADDCGLRLAEIKTDAEGILQNWKERRNALTNEEHEALTMVREYGDMLTTARAAKLGMKHDAYIAAKWLQYTTKEEWLSILPAFGFAVEMRGKHQERIEELNAEILEISEAQEYLYNYLTGATPSVIPTTDDALPFESAKPVDVMATFERLVKAHPDQVVDYVVKHRDIRATTDADELQEVIDAITGNRISAEDVLQSFDEVLDADFAGFYETLNAEYAVNPKMYQSELAACVEAYAE